VGLLSQVIAERFAGHCVEICQPLPDAFGRHIVHFVLVPLWRRKCTIRILLVWSRIQLRISRTLPVVVAIRLRAQTVDELCKRKRSEERESLENQHELKSWSLEFL